MRPVKYGQATILVYLFFTNTQFFKNLNYRIAIPYNTGKLFKSIAYNLKQAKGRLFMKLDIEYSENNNYKHSITKMIISEKELTKIMIMFILEGIFWWYRKRHYKKYTFK